MFDDINRIDSTILKPQQANSKREYRGSAKKRKEQGEDKNLQSGEESDQGYEAQNVQEKHSPGHLLDVQV